MIEPVRPPPDVDALARRLPRRGIAGERAQAMRRALLDAAEPAAPSWLRAHARAIGLGLAVAAAVCGVVAWRGLDHAPPAVAEIVVGDAPATGAPVVRASGDPLPDGAHSVRATRPTQIVRADVTITAPAGAQFDVDIRDGRLQHLAVRSGWVVIAAAHSASTMVVERQTWDLPAPPAAPRLKTADLAAPPTTAPTAVAPTTTAAASSAPPQPSAPSRAPSRTAAVAAVAQAEPATEPSPSTPAEAKPEPAARRTSTSERDFRDGLRDLLAGDATAARAPLDRACATPSSAQADICYWAAIAWLRTGAKDHARQSLEELLIRFPGATHAGEAGAALGWLLLERGDRAGARARFAAAANDSLPGVRADAVRGLAAAR